MIIKSYCPICGHEAELENENETCKECGRFYYVRKIEVEEKENE